MSMLGRGIGFMGGGVAHDTFNLSDKLNMTLSGGNLTATATGYGGVRSITSKTNNTVKAYLELTVGSLAAGITSIGIGISTAILGPTGSDDAKSIGYASDGNIYNNGGVLATCTTYTTGDVIGVTVDTVTAGWQIGFYKNNLFQTAINLTANGAAHDPSFAMWGSNNIAGNSGTINLGGSAFVYAIPSGFVAWS